MTDTFMCPPIGQTSELGSDSFNRLKQSEPIFGSHCITQMNLTIRFLKKCRRRVNNTLSKHYKMERSRSRGISTNMRCLFIVADCCDVSNADEGVEGVDDIKFLNVLALVIEPASS